MVGMRRLCLFAFTTSSILLGSVVVACDDGEGTGGSSSTTSSSSMGSSMTTGSTSSSGNTSSTTGSGTVCDGPGFGGGETAVPGGAITATIVDAAMAPVANQPIYICGIDVCSPPATTNASGDAMISTNLMMKLPAFKFGDALTYPEFAILLTDPSTTFGTIPIAKLPATGQPLAPGADATVGGVTISIPAGASLEIDPFIYDTPDKQAFRAVPIPTAGAQIILADVGAGFDLLYGMSPAETLVCPAAKISVPNTAGWAANAPVEFWEMTIDAAQTYAPYGGWTKASDGVVTADGTRVETTQGFAMLQNFAVRLKP